MNKESAAHRTRVLNELKEAGVTPYGKSKLESDYLPNVIHADEHIMGVAYGRNIKEKNPSFLKTIFFSDSSMLIATNLRVIYLDRKPMFSLSDELTYDIVSGVSYGEEWPFATLTLHTRIGDYTLRYVNKKSAHKFVAYVEKRRLESQNGTAGSDSKTTVQTEFKSVASPAALSDEAKRFLDEHEVAVLSTLDRTGNLQGAVIYYYAPGGDGRVYFINKAETHKAHNILANGQVALTIYDEQKLQTLQLSGQAMIENSPEMKQTVFTQLMHEREYAGEKRMPPITQLHEGAFMVINITPTDVKFTDFKQLPQ